MRCSPGISGWFYQYRSLSGGRCQRRSTIEDVQISTVEQEDAPLGVATQYRFTLDDTLTDGLAIAFYSSHHEIDVYLDGEAVYSRKGSEQIPMVKTVGATWNMIPVSQSDAGKEVLVVRYPVYADYRGNVTFLLGNPLEIYRQELRQSLPEIVVSLLNILIGFGFMVYGLYHFLRKKENIRNTFFLGAVAAGIGLWRIFDARFSPFIIEQKPVFLYYISITMLSVISVELLFSTRGKEENRWQKIRALIETGMCVIILVQMILQWAGRMDIRESLTGIHGMLLASSIIVVTERIIPLLYDPKSGIANVKADSSWLIPTGVLIDLVLFLTKKTSSGLLISLCAVLLYVMQEGIRNLRYNYQEKQRLAAELEKVNSHDALTGLYNRNHYMSALRRFEVQPPGTLGLILLDINGLSSINQAHGLSYGDKVLKRTADILKDRYPEGLYRIGGDEFVILCTDLTKEEFKNQTVKLRAFLDTQQVCEISIGFAWSEEDFIDVHELQNQAREMCIAGKQSYYHNILDAGTAVPHSGYASEVLREIASDIFAVHYQPQMDIETGKIIGVEALVRKKAEDGSLIPPGNFIPFYEMSGVISHVDLFVLKTACASLRQWKEQGYDLRVSVNFSRATLLEEHIVDVIAGICKENQVPTSSIVVEVTESISKMDNDQLHALVKQLKDSGFTISLDDFGSKCSNMAILSSVDFDEIKFDRSLIHTLEENEKSRVVIEAALQMCRAMGNKISLAEGIETKGQLDILTGYQCKCGQGYYFSRPLPQEQFEGFLKEYSLAVKHGEPQ